MTVTRIGGPPRSHHATFLTGLTDAVAAGDPAWGAAHARYCTEATHANLVALVDATRIGRARMVAAALRARFGTAMQLHHDGARTDDATVVAMTADRAIADWSYTTSHPGAGAPRTAIGVPARSIITIGRPEVGELVVDHIYLAHAHTVRAPTRR